MKGRIRNFLEFYYESHAAVTSKNEIEKVMEKLPKILKDDLAKEINGKIIEQFPFFKFHFSSKTVEKMIPQLTEKYYLPSEFVYRSDEPDIVEK